LTNSKPHLLLSDLASFIRLQRIRILLACVFFFSLALHGPQVLNGLNENNSFRQSQTVMLVREFMRNGFDLGSPIPVFGFNSRIPFEFPLFQFIAAILGNLANLDPIVATRVVGLIFFELAALMLFTFAHKVIGFGPAFVALVVFLFSPFALMWAASATIEFCAVFLMLLSINSLYKYSEANQFYEQCFQLFIFSSALLLASLVKITTAIVMSVLFLIMWDRLVNVDDLSLMKFRLKLRMKILIFPCVVVLAINLLWIQFADSIKAQNKFTALLTSHALAEWNYGTLQDRLDVTNSFKIVNTYWGPIVGGIGGLFLLMVIGFFLGDKKFAYPVILSLISGPLFFMNLYAVHDYYSIAVFSSIVLLIAHGYRVIFSLGEEIFKTKRIYLSAFFLVTLFLTSAASTYGKDYLYQKFVEPNTYPALATEINKYSSVTENVIYVGCDWSSLVPYYVDRTALMIPPWAPNLSESDLVGFQVVAVCSLEAENARQTLDDIRGLDHNLVMISANVFRLEKISQVSN
jgi:hypothetical protein